MDKEIRILIADDHKVVRMGLQAMMHTKTSLKIIGEASNGNEAISLAKRLEPDVILLDLEMPQKDGLTTLRELRKNNPYLPILILTGFCNDTRIVQAIKDGASGCLVKDSLPDALVAAIHTVFKGKPFLDPNIAMMVLSKLHQKSKTTSLPENILSSREIGVLKLLARGFSNQEIAKKLEISTRTVGTHVSTILNKLHLSNRTQAALYALQTDLVQLENTL